MARLPTFCVVSALTLLLSIVSANNELTTNGYAKYELYAAENLDSRDDDLYEWRNIMVKQGRLYSMNVTLGGQEFALNLDTTTNNVWVYNSSVSTCKSTNKNKHCATGTRYDKTKSKTYTNLNLDYNVSSPDGTFASGEYALDKLQIGDDIRVDNFTFGLVNTTTKISSPGSFGLGFLGDGGTDDGHVNFLTAIRFSDQISYPLASFWLPQGDKAGGVLMGAVDQDKYQDGLRVMPLNEISGGDGKKYPFIQLSRLGVCGQSGSEKNLTDEHYDVPVMIDSTSEFTYLPYNTIVEIATEMGASYKEDGNFWHLSCGYRQYLSNGTLNLYFHDAKIEVPLQDMVYPVLQSDGKPVRYNKSGEKMCALRFLDQSILGHASIGTTVLSSMYTVFDYNFLRVGIGQSNVNSTKERIRAVTSGLTDIRGVTMMTPSSLVPVTTQAPNTTGAENGARVYVSDGNLITSGTNVGAASTDDSPMPKTSSTKSARPTGAAPHLSSPHVALTIIAFLLSVL